MIKKICISNMVEKFYHISIFLLWMLIGGNIQAQTFDSTLTGTNDQSLNELMNNHKDTINSGTDLWQKYLVEEWEKARTQFAWTNTNGVSGINHWDGTEAATCPKTGTRWEVSTGAQLRYVANVVQSGDTIKLMNDIDLMGYVYNWATPANEQINVTFDGNKHTIFNVGNNNTVGDTTTGNASNIVVFMQMNNSCTVKDITFVSCKLVSDKNFVGVGIFGRGFRAVASAFNMSTYTNVTIRESLLFSSGKYDGIQSRSYVSPFASHTVTATNCYSINNNCYAFAIHVSVAFGYATNSIIKKSFATGGTVISGDGHSGGFISCSDGNLTVENCFSNTKVYGNKQTGVFIGALVPAFPIQNLNCTFTNCFSTGVIEGVENVGGFIGFLEPYGGGTAQYTFTNCYTTALTGMLTGGTKVGGFIGSISPKYGTDGDMTFSNCYAAGEVGYIDISVLPNRTLKNGEGTGGFVGYLPSNYLTSSKFKFTNCFYDKQTTAMKEWGIGNYGTNTNATTIYNALGSYYGGGLKGVLTSRSTKQGAGLADFPSNTVGAVGAITTTTGFTGFDGAAGTVDTTTSNSNWIYEGGNTDRTLHNCLYPMLRVFAEATEVADSWGNHDIAMLVRAQSYASASTVHLGVWDECLSGSGHAPLSFSTYATVRDLTKNFTMTSYLTPANDGHDHLWNISWNKTNQMVSLYTDTAKPVINYLEKTFIDKYGRNYWMADQFAPGVEWLTQTLTFGTATAERRIRVIPTMNIHPGADVQNLVVGNYYNHAKECWFAYGSARCMAANIDSVNTGYYPDNVSEATKTDPRTCAADTNIYHAQCGSIWKRNAMPPVLTQTQEAANAQFNTNYLGVKMWFMDGADMTASDGPDTHEPNNFLNMSLFKIDSVDRKTGRIYYYKNVYLSNSDTIMVNGVQENSPEKARLNQTWNGLSPLKTEDVGGYLLEYVWVQPDARYMQDGKMITVRKDSVDVIAEIKYPSGKRKDDIVNIDIQEYNLTDYPQKGRMVSLTAGSDYPFPDFSNPENPRDTAVLKVEIYKPAFVGVQKTKNPSTVTNVRIEINTTFGLVTHDYPFPYVDTPFTFTTDYYGQTVAVDGVYYANIFKVTRTYIVKYAKQDGNPGNINAPQVGDYYYILLNNSYEEGLDHVYDVGDDTRIIFTITGETFNFPITNSGCANVCTFDPAGQDICLTFPYNNGTGDTVIVDKDDDQTFRISAKEGETIKKLKIDGTSVPIANSENSTYNMVVNADKDTLLLTFKAVTAAHSFEVECNNNPAPPTYTVIYNGNGNTGGTEPTDNNSYEEGNNVIVLDNTGSLSKPYYLFGGWNTEADESGTHYNAGETFTMPAMNVTLYAVWNINPAAFQITKADETCFGDCTGTIRITPILTGLSYELYKDTVSQGSNCSGEFIGLCSGNYIVKIVSGTCNN